jgi:GT2 family glycosyltransferase
MERKICLGAPTYNDYKRIQNLLSSIFTFTPKDQMDECNFVIVDDGTPNETMKQGLREVCGSFNIPLIEHDKNYGIPKAWNTLANYYSSAVYVILLNDDIQIFDPNWLKCMMYFLENNEKIGAVGWPLIHISPHTGQPNPQMPPPNYDTTPGRVGAPVGCSFAFKKESYDLVPGGFPECLPSFYEEIWFGFELARAGLPSYMMPFPALEHWGSQTFSKNAELSIAIPDSNILPMEKYKEIMSKKYPPERIEPVPGYVYRMDYSRVVFALHFECEDLIEQPQVEVHHRLVDVLPKQKIKWLDKNMQPQEQEL